jgi:hypothetical protein
MQAFVGMFTPIYGTNHFLLNITYMVLRERLKNAGIYLPCIKVHGIFNNGL